jgi:hypothetical protein
VDPLTLEQLEQLDPRAPERGQERRFLCPYCGTDKPHDASHRSLAVNRDTGAWRCWRCGEKGKLREFWQERESPPRDRRSRARQQLRRSFAIADPVPIPVGEPEQGANRTLSAWRDQLRDLEPVAGSPGEGYLLGRGIPADVAHAAGIRYCPSWFGRTAVLFPLYDPEHRLHGAQGRYVDGRTDPKSRTGGAPKLGAFLTPGALESESMVIAEAPLDALVLSLCGVPAIGPTGCSAFLEWLPKVAIGKRAFLATDADEAGDTAADQWRDRLTWASSVERLRPPAKDWAEALLELGRDGLTAWLRAALWNEAGAWERIHAAYRWLAENVTSETFAPELLQADAAIDAAFAAEDAAALETALRQFKRAHLALIDSD